MPRCNDVGPWWLFDDGGRRRVGHGSSVNANGDEAAELHQTRWQIAFDVISLCPVVSTVDTTLLPGRCSDKRPRPGQMPPTTWHASQICTSIVTESSYIAEAGLSLRLFELKLELRWRSTNCTKQAVLAWRHKKHYKQRRSFATRYNSVKQRHLHSWCVITVHVIIDFVKCPCNVFVIVSL